MCGGGPGEQLERRPRAAIPALPRQGPDALAAALAPIASEPAPRPARRSTPPPAPMPMPMAEPMPARQVRQSNRMDASRDYLDAESDDAPRRAPRRGRGLVLALCALVLAAGVALLVAR